MDLIRYNTIVLAGNFREWTEADAAKLKDWISDGGTLIACENASEWASRMKLGTVTFKKQAEPDKTRYLKYNERGKERYIPAKRQGSQCEEDQNCDRPSLPFPGEYDFPERHFIRSHLGQMGQIRFSDVGHSPFSSSVFHARGQVRWLHLSDS